MRNVLVTGASRGIGRAVAAAFAEEDCNIFVNALHGGAAFEENIGYLGSVRASRQTAGLIAGFPGDAGDPAFVERMFADIFGMLKKSGLPQHIDVLVNNAGIAHVGLVQDMTCEEWDRIVATNLSSVHYCSRAVIPGMLAAGGGRIISISSVWGNVGASCEVAYSATKGGVNAYTKALAKELAPSGIAVNAIACGCVDTDMNRCFGPEEREALCEEIPAGRFAQAEEVAKLVRSLAEQSPYLTGQIITMDGGWT